MRTKTLVAIGLVVSLLCLSSCNDKDELNIYGTINGKVTNVTNGEPLSAAIVTLVPGSSTSQTSDDGSFTFSGLKEGQYTVSVQKDGYQANRKDVSVFSGEETEIVITLTAIPK